ARHWRDVSGARRVHLGDDAVVARNRHLRDDRLQPHGNRRVPAARDARPSAGIMTGRGVRQAARAGALHGGTAGPAPGCVQGNLVVVPASLADDFATFCRLNPKPCPVIGRTEPGVPHVPELGADVDVRTDLPRYRVWRDGALSEEIPDVSHLWREHDDLVAFV